jgi:hypothetical protein
MVLVPISDFQRSLGSLDSWKDQILLRLHPFNNESEVIRLFSRRGGLDVLDANLLRRLPTKRSQK